MSILDTVLFAAALLGSQVILAAVLIAVFMRLRIVERDTRLPEEYGKTPGDPVATISEKRTGM